MTKAKAQKEEQEWDKYWTKKKTKSQTLYRIIASLYRDLIIKRALNYFITSEFKTGTKLLHAGSGAGQVDKDIVVKFNITALDISAEALKLYKLCNGEKVKTIKASIFAIPAKSGTFDGVYNLGVMEHFAKEEDEKILIELRRVLKANGKIVLFWPPKYGPTVLFLNSTHFVLNKILKRNIRLHPEEISLVESKKQVERILKATGFKLLQFYFGPKDLFTHCVVVAKKI
ncbi:MAG TPA: methyltransferase domain-containing protein [Patescibacteria group bacterium]|jgi:2-polyprenyl-3-methyl-5-hydroxy-6-metoxy-1,4-benzoquinol methylase|nr:methyltransferase domain-containing protein [Patescibacteria group bacterium]